MKQKQVIQKGKSRIWVGSIIAALVTAVGIFAMMMQWEKNMLSRYEKGMILVAAKSISEGQMITKENVNDYFELLEVDKGCIPETALTSMEEITEMVPVADIEKGVLLTKGMFETMDEVIGKMQMPVIAGLKADDLYQVVGGVLRTGDRIHIYSVTEEGTVRLHWKNVFVHQVFDNAGNSIGNEDKHTAAQRMNVYLEQGNVEQFYTELAAGTLRVVKVCE